MWIRPFEVRHSSMLDQSRKLHWNFKLVAKVVQLNFRWTWLSSLWASPMSLAYIEDLVFYVASCQTWHQATRWDMNLCRHHVGRMYWKVVIFSVFGSFSQYLQGNMLLVEFFQVMVVIPRFLILDLLPTYVVCSIVDGLSLLERVTHGWCNYQLLRYNMNWLHFIGMHGKITNATPKVQLGLI